MTKLAFLKSRLGSLGGAEKYSRELVKAFVAAGCFVTALTTGSPKKDLLPGIEWVSMGETSSFSLYNLFKFDRRCQRWLQDNPVEVVFGMDRNSYQTHYRAGNGVHAAYLNHRRRTDSWLKCASFSLNPLHYYILKLEKAAYENPGLKRLFTNSEMVRQEVLNHYNVDPDKVKVVHNGVEWEQMRGDFDAWPSVRDSLSQVLCLDRSVYQFLFVGNGFKRKGLDLLLRGLTCLRDKNFHLSVVGKDKNSSSFKELASGLGLAKQVTFFGERSDIRQFYQTADALVIPSTYDPFANVTVEALAMGLFVVSSSLNGGAEVLSPATGVVIQDLFRADSIAAALGAAMRHPKSPFSSQMIRQSVAHLDFSKQIGIIVADTCKVAKYSRLNLK